MTKHEGAEFRDLKIFMVWSNLFMFHDKLMKLYCMNDIIL